MSSYNPKSSTEFRSASIPLINISPSPSAERNTTYARETGLNAGEDSDDDWGDSHVGSLRQPFLAQYPDGYKLTGWKAFFQGGGLGQWLFTTQWGWTFYIGILVFWLGGCQIGLTIMNRIILWSGYLKENYTSHTKLITMIAGVYKFPYPITTTYIEMLMTHAWILLSAYITRWVSLWLTRAGLSGMIAPSWPLQMESSSLGLKGQGKKGWSLSGSRGIAGGGLFEFDRPVVKQCLPLAVIFVLKVLLSNLSFTYAQLPIYVLARIAIVPLSLIFTSLLAQQQHSVSTISAALTATLTLFVATVQSNMRTPWEAVIYGVLSSVFVALYPVQIQRTYKAVLASLIPQGDSHTTLPQNSNPNCNLNPTSLPADLSGTPSSTRAYWTLLHHTSLLSILIFTPLPFLSGEILTISRHCYTLDIFFNWLMIVCGGLGSWAVFWSTIALTRATSPLTATFLFVPRAAFLLPLMWRFRMESFQWVGLGICWVACLWFAWVRRREGGGLRGLR